MTSSVQERDFFSAPPEKPRMIRSFFNKHLVGFTPLGKVLVGIASIAAGIALPIVGGILTFWACSSLGKRNIKRISGEKSLFFLAPKGVADLKNFTKSVHERVLSFEDMEKLDHIVKEITTELRYNQSPEYARVILSYLNPLCRDHLGLVHNPIFFSFADAIPQDALKNQSLAFREECFLINPIFIEMSWTPDVAEGARRALKETAHALNDAKTVSDITPLMYRIRFLCNIIKDSDNELFSIMNDPPLRCQEWLSSWITSYTEDLAKKISTERVQENISWQLSAFLCIVRDTLKVPIDVSALGKKMNDAKEAHYLNLAENLRDMAFLEAAQAIKFVSLKSLSRVAKEIQADSFEKWGDEFIKNPLVAGGWEACLTLNEGLWQYHMPSSFFAGLQKTFVRASVEKLVSLPSEERFVEEVKKFSKMNKDIVSTDEEWVPVAKKTTSFFNDALRLKDMKRINRLLLIDSLVPTEVDKKALASIAEPRIKSLVQAIGKQPTEENLTQFVTLAHLLHDMKMDQHVELYNNAIKKLPKQAIERLREYARAPDHEGRDMHAWVAFMVLHQQSQGNIIPDIALRERMDLCASNHKWPPQNVYERFLTSKLGNNEIRDLLAQAVANADLFKTYSENPLIPGSQNKLDSILRELCTNTQGNYKASFEKCQYLNKTFPIKKLLDAHGRLRTLLLKPSVSCREKIKVMEGLPLSELVNSEAFDFLIEDIKLEKKRHPEMELDPNEFETIRSEIRESLNALKNIPIEKRLTAQDLHNLRRLDRVSSILSIIQVEWKGPALTELETQAKEAGYLQQILREASCSLTNVRSGDILYTEEAKFKTYCEKTTPVFSGPFRPSLLLALLKRLKRGNAMWDAYEFVFGKYGHASMASTRYGNPSQYHIDSHLTYNDITYDVFYTNDVYRPCFTKMLTQKGREYFAKEGWTEEKLEHYLSSLYATVQTSDFGKHAEEDKKRFVSGVAFLTAAFTQISFLPTGIQKKVQDLFFSKIFKRCCPKLCSAVNFSKMPEKNPNETICSAFVAQLVHRQCEQLNTVLQSRFDSPEILFVSPFPEGTDFDTLHPNLLQKHLRNCYERVPESDLGSFLFRPFEFAESFPPKKTADEPVVSTSFISQKTQTLPSPPAIEHVQRFVDRTKKKVLSAYDFEEAIIIQSELNQFLKSGQPQKMLLKVVEPLYELEQSHPGLVQYLMEAGTDRLFEATPWNLFDNQPLFLREKGFSFLRFHSGVCSSQDDYLGIIDEIYKREVDKINLSNDLSEITSSMKRLSFYDQFFTLSGDLLTDKYPILYRPVIDDCLRQYASQIAKTISALTMEPPQEFLMKYAAVFRMAQSLIKFPSLSLEELERPHILEEAEHSYYRKKQERLEQFEKLEASDATEETFLSLFHEYEGGALPPCLHEKATSFLNVALRSHDISRIRRLVRCGPFDPEQVERSSLAAIVSPYISELIQNIATHPTERLFNEFFQLIDLIKKTNLQSGLEACFQTLRQLDDASVGRIQAYNETFHENEDGYLAFLELHQQAKEDFNPVNT